MGGKYLLEGYFGKMCFSGQLWPDLGNTAWAAMAGMGCIGLNFYISVS